MRLCDYCGFNMRLLLNWYGRKTWVCVSCGLRREEHAKQT